MPFSPELTSTSFEGLSYVFLDVFFGLEPFVFGWMPLGFNDYYAVFSATPAKCQRRGIF